MHALRKEGKSYQEIYKGVEAAKGAEGAEKEKGV
jgi:hypothetical protein